MCNKITCNRKRGSYCFLLRCSRVGCIVSGWVPGNQWSLRTCGMLGAKWAHSWAAYWALWRRRIVTSCRPRPFFWSNGSSCFYPSISSHGCPPHPQPRSSPQQTGELGLSAWMATSPPPLSPNGLTSHLSKIIYPVQGPPPFESVR